eukprot:2975205-Rhodomonas_salina.1
MREERSVAAGERDVIARHSPHQTGEIENSPLRKPNVRHQGHRQSVGILAHMRALRDLLHQERRGVHLHGAVIIIGKLDLDLLGHRGWHEASVRSTCTTALGHKDESLRFDRDLGAHLRAGRILHLERDH